MECVKDFDAKTIESNFKCLPIREIITPTKVSAENLRKIMNGIFNQFCVQISRHFLFRNRKMQTLHIVIYPATLIREWDPPMRGNFKIGRFLGSKFFLEATQKNAKLNYLSFEAIANMVRYLLENCAFNNTSDLYRGQIV
ncbi:hypothetical protein EGR_09979 [Echinococcus granulosus]|uniref:Uncharacterized protein n=1 Tax=Echinococcus granulosus TaxID=6210 RepID=W6UP15_ECHGR|nr:hypothetical protein EGR_09979 [Echinococcus granulosus]EUB55149.1 hypothetical protein EGR_09979 [Echinococcus granulosus]